MHPFYFVRLEEKKKLLQSVSAHKILEKDSDLFSLYTCHLADHDAF